MKTSFEGYKDTSLGGEPEKLPLGESVIMKLNLLSSALMALVLVLNTSQPAAAWFTKDFLTQNYKDFCDDIVAQNQYNDIVGMAQKNSGSTNYQTQQSSSTANKRSKNTSGSSGFLKKTKFGHNTTNENRAEISSSLTNESKWDRGYQYNHDRSRTVSVVAGKNCSTLVETAGQVHMVDQKIDFEREKLQESTKRSFFESIMNDDW